ncbi:MAG: heme-dependent oxidative N-demethylase family protein [Cypionkella sp.]
MSQPIAPLILQSRLPILPWMQPALWRLPGIQPLDPESWLEVDDAYAAHLGEKARLMATKPAEVHVMPEAARPAAVEVLELVLDQLSRKPGFAVSQTLVTRPDGVQVTLDRDAPLLTLGALVQEDICILQKQGDEHVLTAALLCFPASWTLSEKIGRPLTTIHVPVKPYDDQMARRVQRLFDAIRPDQPLWRMNALLYADPALHQPKSETNLRPRIGARDYLRAERQCLLRLPDSGAVVFSIHTYVVKAATLTEAERVALIAGGH